MISREMFTTVSESSIKIVNDEEFESMNLSFNGNFEEKITILTEIFNHIGIPIEPVPNNKILINGKEFIVELAWIKTYGGRTTDYMRNNPDNISREVYFGAKKENIDSDCLSIGIDLMFDESDVVDYENSYMSIIGTNPKLRNTDFSEKDLVPSKSMRLSLNDIKNAYVEGIQFIQVKHKDLEEQEEFEVTGVLISLSSVFSTKEVINEVIESSVADKFFNPTINEKNKITEFLINNINYKLEPKSSFSIFMSKTEQRERAKIKKNIDGENDKITGEYIASEICEYAHIYEVWMIMNDLKTFANENSIDEYSSAEEISIFRSENAEKIAEILSPISDEDNIIPIEPTFHAAWDKNIISIDEDGSISVTGKSIGLQKFASISVELNEKNIEYLEKRKNYKVKRIDHDNPQ